MVGYIYVNIQKTDAKCLSFDMNNSEVVTTTSEQYEDSFGITQDDAIIIEFKVCRKAKKQTLEEAVGEEGADRIKISMMDWQR